MTYLCMTDPCNISMYDRYVYVISVYDISVDDMSVYDRVVYNIHICV